MTNKYGAVKTSIDNIVFDSKREAARYQELLLLQRGKAIRDLNLQVPFPVIVNGKKICVYIADFQYIDVVTNQIVTEDVKGVRTPVYRIKSKLVEALYGVKIVEVA